MKKRGAHFHLWTKTRPDVCRDLNIGPYPAGRSSVPPLFSNAPVETIGLVRVYGKWGEIYRNVPVGR